MASFFFIKFRRILGLKTLKALIYAPLIFYPKKIVDIYKKNEYILGFLKNQEKRKKKKQEKQRKIEKKTGDILFHENIPCLFNQKGNTSKIKFSNIYFWETSSSFLTWVCSLSYLAS